MLRLRFFLIALFAVGLTACASKVPEMETVENVDLERFMGDWYVIANIPTFLEKDAYNAVETYRLDDDGSIDTTFTYRKGIDDVTQLAIAGDVLRMTLHVAEARKHGMQIRRLGRDGSVAIGFVHVELPGRHEGEQKEQ